MKKMNVALLTTGMFASWSAFAVPNCIGYGFNPQSVDGGSCATFQCIVNGQWQATDVYFDSDGNYDCDQPSDPGYSCNGAPNGIANVSSELAEKVPGAADGSSTKPITGLTPANKLKIKLSYPTRNGQTVKSR